MSEPRRWWTEKPIIGTAAEALVGPDNAMIEVVKASAYDAVKSEMGECSAHYKAARKLISKIQNDRRVAYRKIIDLKADRNRLIEALRKVQSYGLHHHEYCSKREYDDLNCDCGTEDADLIMREALTKEAIK